MQNTNMSARERYREQLRTLESWDDFLLENSGLPGPRGNIELAQAVADEGSDKDFARFRTYGSNVAPTNSKYEFLAFCGVLGLGRLLAEGNLQFLSTLREFASDPRWRTREAVAMALQRLGEVNMPALITEMKLWSKGNRLEPSDTRLNYRIHSRRKGPEVPGSPCPTQRASLLLECCRVSIT